MRASPSLDRKPLAIDLLAVGNDAGNGAEAAHHTHGLRIGVIGQRIGEQVRVEFVGLAVDVEVSPRKAGRDHGHAQPGCACEQVVDEAILGFAQRQRIEARLLEEFLRINASRMRRAQHERSRLLTRRDDEEGRIEFGTDGVR